MLLFHVFDISITRATVDVDFAIAIDSWERFRQLRTALIASGEFREGKLEHRPYLRSAEEIPVDIIPFGGVAEGDVIHWPPARETAMIVAGFNDAIRTAVHLEVNDNLTIPVASLAGIAILKLFAWSDRHTSDKDVLDLYRVIITTMQMRETLIAYTKTKSDSWSSQALTWNWLEPLFLNSMLAKFAALKRQRKFANLSVQRIPQKGWQNEFVCPNFRWSPNSCPKSSLSC